VGVLTVAFPYVPVKLIRELDALCEKHGVTELSEGFRVDLLALFKAQATEQYERGYGDGESSGRSRARDELRSMLDGGSP
jgi:hypothetical protein